MNDKYGALQTIAFLFKCIAWIVLIAGGITSLLFAVSTILARDAGASSAIGFVSILLASALLYCIILTFSEGITLFIDIEYNTRMMVEKNGA